MPIKFRCRHCRQFLGISRAQAGEITDCPMCGKSIRVPNLDGTIEPIPPPELDLKDSQLIEALSELAEIGQSRPATEATSPPRVSETHEATVIIPHGKPAPPPKAVPVSSGVPIAEEDSDTIIQGGNDGGTVIEPEDPLASLAAAEIRPVSRSTGRAAQNRPLIWVIGIGTALLATVLAVVWISGGEGHSKAPAGVVNEQVAIPDRGEPREPSGEASQIEIAKVVADPPLEPALTGRVTFIGDNGDTQPDAGARILLLPRSKPGTVKLDVAGFLAGSDSIDADVARAAIRALGGDLATADEDGHYQLIPGSAGDYRLLVISRHRSRETTSAIDPQLQEALSAYFFRPASLLGELAFRFDEFHYGGHGTSHRDFSFAGQ